MSEIIPTDILQIGTGIPYNNTISSISGTNTIFNENKLNIDFEVRGTGSYSSLYYDASTGRLGIGTGVPDAVLHVIAPCAKDGLIVESITNCPTGVTLLLVHNPQTPPQTGSFPAIINLAGRDTNYNEVHYAQIKSKILNPLTGSTSGEIIFLVDHTGVSKPVFSAGVTNLVLGANNSTSGYGYQVLGQNNVGSGNYYLYVGSNNSGVRLSDSVLIGSDNQYYGPKLFAIVNDSVVDGSGSFVLGLNNNNSGVNSILCGSNTTATGSYNLLLANNTIANTHYVLGLVQSGVISGISGVVIGSNVFSRGNDNISIGNNNSTSGNSSSIVGSYVSSSGNRNIIFGNNIVTSGHNLIVIGSDHVASGINDGIFIGNNLDLVDSKNVLYVGFNNTTESGLSNSVVVGANNDLDNGNIMGIVLLGQHNLTNNIDNSIIIGNTNNASGTLKNNILLGSGNAIVSNSYNNIVVGTLNNQTGVYVNSQGEVTGVPSFVNTNSVNSISIGTNNIIHQGNANLLVGQKNTTSGTNLNLLGSFNIARNTDRAYVLGNSNYIEGDNIIALGRNILGLGRDLIALNNANSPMGIYGSGSIGVGNNRMIYSGIVVGQNNNLYGISGLIYGKNNNVGFMINSFSYVGGDATISVNGAWSHIYKENDRILTQTTNPTGPDELREFTITNPPTVDTINNKTILTINGILSAPSDRLYRINNSFDDNNNPTPTFSGLILPLKDTQSDKYYGSNNIIVGDNNTVIYSHNTILGTKNISSGNNSIVIGHNISGVSDNSVHIGTSNTNKIVIDNTQIVYNTGTAQEKIIVKNFANNIASYHDLINSRLGINNSAPRSDLDVSGTITASSLRMGLSATSGYVLTTNANGVGSWEFPVNLSGVDNALLYRVTDKVASGIEGISYIANSTASGINFYDNIYITNTGLVINPDRASNIEPVEFVVWGSGGSFAPKLLEILPGQNIANLFDLTAQSGGFSRVSVSDAVRLPNNLTGTFLYVNNSGNLLSTGLHPHSVLFASSNSWASGNTKFRWVDNQSVLAMTTGGNITTTDIDTSDVDLTYNVILSSNNDIHTSFNNQGLNSRFSVYKSGPNGRNQRQGFHIIPSDGRIGINTTVAEMTTNDNSNSTLLVDGKISAENLRLTSQWPTGLYLRTTLDGDLVPSTIDINASFTGTYPLEVQIDGNNRVQVQISRSKSDGNPFTVPEFGRMLNLTANGWVAGTGLQVFQSDASNNKGAMIGYGTSLTLAGGDSTLVGAPSQANGIVYGGGSFTNSETNRLGSSQFNQFFLRGVTNNGDKRALTMNWDTATNQSSTRVATPNNVMRLRGDRDTTWTYRIIVSCLWQNNTGRGGLGFIAEGTVARISGFLPVNVGSPTITKHRGTTDPNFEIYVEPSGGSFAGINDVFLNLAVSGANAHNCLWSATALINQVQWPSNLNYS